MNAVRKDISGIYPQCVNIYAPIHFYYQRIKRKMRKELSLRILTHLRKGLHVFTLTHFALKRNNTNGLMRVNTYAFSQN